MWYPGIFKFFMHIFRAKMSCPLKLTELLRLWTSDAFKVRWHLQWSMYWKCTTEECASERITKICRYLQVKLRNYETRLLEFYWLLVFKPVAAAILHVFKSSAMQGRSDGGIWVYIHPKISLSGLFRGVKMTPERLLNMSIKFYTSSKNFIPPNKFLATPLQRSDFCRRICHLARV